MADPRPTLASAADAERFVAAFTATIDELDGLLAQETASLAAGRVRDALARLDRKSDLTGGYLRAMEFARANAVALARFAPGSVPALRDAHGRLRETVQQNQSVLATAKAVSEGFVKGVSAEVIRQSRPAGYGAPSRAGSPARTAGPARPLVMSGTY